ncbi:uncharacterized protein CDV56_100287 [Aspergillus thermomutatus]|uniref:Metal homeostatis protein bsd2 n=1 Tax=Aspergillus thermomutatus TaxID=41047 RepID=A0A397G941_ASPTH|nr:uncharacterized protein CDV56_100287 [Aspergillus thermomutatus]RHZ46138.1 hypothetical protein CDV56_100287 [Aspergillus thermomutatus]
MSSQRYQRVNAHDDDEVDSHSSIPLQTAPAPSSPPPSFHSRSSSFSSRRLLQNGSHRSDADQTLADAFGDGSDSEADDEPDDRQRLMRAHPEQSSPAGSGGDAAPSSAASNEPPSQRNQSNSTLQRRPTILPSFSTPSSGAGRMISSSNDGVFANLAAKPERGEKNEDLPPSYEEAAADATPPYWETTILAPGISSNEVYVDGLPVGSVFSFVWNAMISMSFQLVGFLLTYLLHTTHAAKNGSRAGLGLTLVQYGFYMKGGSDAGSGDGGSDYVPPPDPNSHNFDPTSVSDGSSGGNGGGGAVSDITTSEWISYVLMIVGWFILIRAISDFLRARRHEQLVLQSPERGLSVPLNLLLAALRNCPTVPASPPRLFVLLRNSASRHFQASNTAHPARSVHLRALRLLIFNSMAKVDGAADAASASSPASLNPNIPQGPVEARSLSSITTIASNPPAYPRNPTQKKLDPLVLYIVRVPGSKDVFLSPLKPPTKSSISAEAINASLYYLHVATPEDDILLQEVEEEREQQARLQKEQLSEGAEAAKSPAEFARLNNVRRKPVPGGGSGASSNLLPQTQPVGLSQPLQQENHSPYPPTFDSQRPLIPTRPMLSQGFSSSESVTAGPWASNICDQYLGDSPGDTGETRAPPLPPRPRPFVPTTSDPINNSPSGKKNHRWSALSGYLNSKGLDSWKEKYEAMSAGRLSFDARRPELRPHTSDGAGSNVCRGSPSRSPGQSPHRRPRDHGQASDRRGFHITLIRRDPTHGSQWNVATISTSKTDSTAVDIEVSTPGYNRFLAQDEPFSLQSLGINLPSDAQCLPSSAFKFPTQSQTEPPSRDPSLPRKFRRQLCVSRPHHQRDDSRGSLDMPTNRASLDTFNGSPTRPHSQAHSKLKSGYYTFISPWNGICTFSTSVNGRSLKCKHMIPTPSYPGNGTTPSSPGAPAVTVAEIRFNTPFQAGHLHHQPSSTHISPFTLSQTSTFRDPSASASDTPGQTPASKRNSLAQFLNPTTYTRPRSRSGASASSVSSLPRHGHSHTRNPSSSSTSSGGPDDRLDLSLAREPAGGGMRGKSAKLGKLIIEDEGIKMLDLVVAACMAVWWRGYYH